MLRVMTGVLAVATHVVIGTAFETIVHETSNWSLLAVGTIKALVKVTRAITRRRGSRWHTLYKNTNGVRLIFKLTFGDDPQGGQGFLDIIAWNGHSVVLVI